MVTVESVVGREKLELVRRGDRLARLSKSRFMLGLRCPLALYLQSYAPELAADASDAQQAILDQGQHVGSLARNRFPRGLLIAEDYTRHTEAEEKTRRAMADVAVPAIFEAAFTFEDIRIRVDVLKRLSADRWALIEVKSSTAVKDYHVPDLAIQKYVLKGCGLTVSEVSLMHLNREYIYDGVSYDLEQLFVIEDLGPEVSTFENDLAAHLDRLRALLRLEAAPRVEPGSCCGQSYRCPFYDLCAPVRPDNWIGRIPYLRGRRAELLTEQRVESILDIPNDFPLTARQRLRTERCSRM
jgi:hypothetical protein